MIDKKSLKKKVSYNDKLGLMSYHIKANQITLSFNDVGKLLILASFILEDKDIHEVVKEFIHHLANIK